MTMEASTQEGRFLVVPATFPGRQEHFTVCDRSSMRFLLQHLWAAITSQVPPSGLCRWCCWKVCWRDPWQSSIAHALIHKYRTQDIAETIAILWKIQPRAGHSPSVHWKELTLFKIHLCHSSEIFFKENASRQFFIKNWKKKKIKLSSSSPIFTVEKTLGSFTVLSEKEPRFEGRKPCHFHL